MSSVPRPVWVVIPARDEAAMIQAALGALDAAATAAAGTVHLVVVDDGSTDATAQLAQASARAWRHGAAEVIPGPEAGAGWARRAGMDRAVIAALAAGLGDALVASTDADSRVPEQWIVRLRESADAGHIAIAGDIQLDPHTEPRLAAARDRRIGQRLRTVRERDPAAEHPHFAGANLACTAALLASVAPLPAPRALEDDALGRLLDERGVPILRDASFPVITSGRLDGRADDGLSRALRDDALGLSLAGNAGVVALPRPEPDPTPPADDRRPSRAASSSN